FHGVLLVVTEVAGGWWLVAGSVQFTSHQSRTISHAPRLDNLFDINVSVASNTPARTSRYHQIVWRRSASSRVGASAATVPATGPPLLASTEALSSSGSMRARFASAGSRLTATRWPMPRGAPSGRIS